MNESLEHINSKINYFLAYHLRDKYPEQISSITDLETTPDLEFCRVYVSVSEDNQRFIDRLNRDTKKIRMALAKKVKLRKAPELIFMLDQSASRYSKIDGLLRSE